MRGIYNARKICFTENRHYTYSSELNKMIETALFYIVCFALALSLFVGIYALFRGQSNKRNYFLLMQAVIVVYLIGYILEITSNNAESAMTAVKILYIGGFFLAPLALFFVADYCEIKLHALFVKVPILVFSLGAVLAQWSNEAHKMVYLDYRYDPDASRHLIFTPGPLYFTMRIFLMVCMFLLLSVMVSRIKRWKGRYRKRLTVFFCCAMVPFLTESAYVVSIVTGVNIHHVNFTPHAVAIMSFFLYAGIVRFNIFEVISAGTASAIQYIKEGIVLVDDDNNYLFSNPAAAEVFPGISGIPKGESIFLIENWPEELKGAESASIDFSMFYERGDCSGEKDQRYFRASVSPVYESNKNLAAKIIIFSDVTDNVNLMKEMQNAACFDSLTGLYNRKHFSTLADANIKRALRVNCPIYAGMLDLDFFKTVNDTYGHAAGDSILKSTAAIIRSTIRSYDLVGRFGGEEFVFLITDMESAEVLKMVERIRENLESYSTIYEDLNIQVTCSIGLAKFLEGDTLESALKKADIALYAAKNGGRNRMKVCDELTQCSADGLLPHTRPLSELTA